MCLYPNQTEPKIAKKKIRGWKFVNDWTYKTWIPVYKYESGELKYNTVLKPKNKQGEELDHISIRIGWFVEEGFHAYLKKPDYDKIRYNNTFRLRKNLKLVRIIIPKGSEYMTNRFNNMIVASKMIVFRTWWDYIKWRLFR